MAVEVENEETDELIADPQPRPSRLARTGPTTVRTGGIRITGIGEIGAIELAMNELPTQISS